MTHRHLLSWLGAVLVFGGLGFVGAAAARAQEQDFSEMIPKPTEEHERLRKEVGVWDAKMTAYMGEEPMTAQGVETNTMLGDFWIVSEFEGEFAGLPFSGRGQYGYDPNAKQYVGSWIDNFSTTLMTMEGDDDKETGALTMIGKTFDPSLGKLIDHKMVSKMIDDDHRTFTMYMKAPEYGEDWVKTMVIEYTRRPEGSQPGAAPTANTADHPVD